MCLFKQVRIGQCLLQNMSLKLFAQKDSQKEFFPVSPIFELSCFKLCYIYDKMWLVISHLLTLEIIELIS